MFNTPPHQKKEKKQMKKKQLAKWSPKSGGKQ